MKIDPYYQRQKCRPLTVVSGDIKFVWIFFVRIFAGFSGEEASNDSGVIENVDFHGFVCYVFGILGNKANIIIQYYLVPCCLSSDPKIYDLE